MVLFQYIIVIKIMLDHGLGMNHHAYNASN